MVTAFGTYFSSLSYPIVPLPLFRTGAKVDEQARLNSRCQALLSPGSVLSSAQPANTSSFLPDQGEQVGRRGLSCDIHSILGWATWKKKTSLSPRLVNSGLRSCHGRSPPAFMFAAMNCSTLADRLSTAAMRSAASEIPLLQQQGQRIESQKSEFLQNGRNL